VARADWEKLQNRRASYISPLKNITIIKLTKLGWTECVAHTANLVNSYIILLGNNL
jgi:hypothetical protein